MILGKIDLNISSEVQRRFNNEEKKKLLRQIGNPKTAQLFSVSGKKVGQLVVHAPFTSDQDTEVWKDKLDMPGICPCCGNELVEGNWLGAHVLLVENGVITNMEYIMPTCEGCNKHYKNSRVFDRAFYVDRDLLKLELTLKSMDLIERWNISK